MFLIALLNWCGTFGFFKNVRYSRAACFSICVIAGEPKTQTDTDTEVVSEWIKSGVSGVYIRCVQRLILPHNTIFYSIFYCAVIKPEAPACITQTLKKNPLSHSHAVSLLSHSLGSLDNSVGENSDGMLFYNILKRKQSCCCVSW